MRKNKLNIACPMCEGGQSRYFYNKEKENNPTCSYCGGEKNVDIMRYYADIKMNPIDQRYQNVLAFINDRRFSDYLEAHERSKSVYSFY